MLLKAIRLRKGAPRRGFSTVGYGDSAYVGDINANPVLKSLFDKERVTELNRRIHFELSHSSRRESMLAEQLKDKLKSNAVNSEFGNNKVTQLEGFTTGASYIPHKTDLRNRSGLTQSFDYDTHLTGDLEKIHYMNPWEYSKNEDKLMANRVLSDYDYIEGMNKVEQDMLKEDGVELEANEVKLVNIPVSYSVKELKQVLGISSGHIVGIARDYFGQVAELKLRFDTEVETDGFFKNNQNKQIQNCLVQIITANNLKEENRSKKTIVIDNLNEDITKDELILDIAQGSKIKNVYFPELLDNTPLQETPDLIKQVRSNSLTSDAALTVREFNGNSFKNYTLRSKKSTKEDDAQESDDFDASKKRLQNLEFINQFTKNDFIELRKNTGDDRLNRAELV